MLLDLPAVGHVGIGIAVDDVGLDDDFGRSHQNGLELLERLRLGTELGHIIGSVSRRLESVCELVHLADGIDC